MGKQPKVVWQTVDPRQYPISMDSVVERHILKRHKEFDESSIGQLQFLAANPSIIKLDGEDADTQVYCQLGFLDGYSQTLWTKLFVRYDASWSGQVVTAYLDSTLGEGIIVWPEKIKL